MKLSFAFCNGFHICESSANLPVKVLHRYTACSAWRSEDALSSAQVRQTNRAIEGDRFQLHDDARTDCRVFNLCLKPQISYLPSSNTKRLPGTADSDRSIPHSRQSGYRKKMISKPQETEIYFRKRFEWYIVYMLRSTCTNLFSPWSNKSLFFV